MNDNKPKFSILDLDSTLHISLIRRIVLVGCVAFASVWIIELSSGLIMEFDAVAYPICIASLLFLVGLSFVSDKMEVVVRMGAFLVASIYLVLVSIWSSFSDLATGNFYTATTALQWLPLIYVVAFLFLRIREALIASALCYISLLIGQYMALSYHFGPDQVWPSITNLGISHLSYMFVLWSIIKLRAANHEAQILAKTMQDYALIDDLTGIFNRRGLEMKLDKLRNTWRQTTVPYTIFMIDIDNFKRINDKYGHLTGDDVLAKIASTLKHHIRPEDVLGRWGGEEFMIISTRLDKNSAINFAERLRAVIEELELAVVGKVTASLGIANSEEADSLKGVILKADQYLYQAKEQGRNRVGSNFTPLKAATNQ